MRKLLPLFSLITMLILSSCGSEEQNEGGLASGGLPKSATAEAADPVAAPFSESAVEDEAQSLAKLESRLEEIRQLLKIPGLAAGVVRDQELIWAKGFGFADLESKVPVTANTPFHLASVTKPIAATVVMQLVEEGILSLDDPISNYGVELEADGDILVRHLLTHTSEGTPGERFRYSGDRYGYLGQVAEAATGRSFRDLIGQRLLEPLNMTHTAPNYGVCGPDGELTWLDEDGWAAGYTQVLQEMARPYMLDEAYQLAGGDYATLFNPAAGLIASISDLAAFDIALDQDRLLQPQTKALMLDPVIPTIVGNEDHQYALGWYIQNYEGTRLEWHTGRWQPSVSALYMRVPEQHMTFFALANTPNLTTPFPAGIGEVMYSTLALTFYRYLVFPELHEGLSLPEIDWSMPAGELEAELAAVDNAEIRRFLAREMWSYRMAYHSVGRLDDVARLAEVRRGALGDIGPLSPHLASAADRPMTEEILALSQAELDAYNGDYELADAGLFSPGEGPPSEVTILTYGGGLVGCAPGDSPLFFIPTGPRRFVTSGGGPGYMNADFGPGPDGQDQITVWFTDQMGISYLRTND